jgi:hypothetical protein
MEDPYAEAPLNLRKQEIRLVKLEHSTDTEPIKCSLRSYAIEDDCPAYVALSYAWGPKERHDDIQLNGVAFPIGLSLWSFLAQMRSQHQYITFWIDALCINQANVLEQNHQVQMMREIYSKAHSVWIWLGKINDIIHSNLAVDFLETQKPTFDNDLDHRKFWSPRIYSAVYVLCSRTYWYRIWIVQEVLLAKRATLLYGSRQVPWTKLLHLISNLQAISDRSLAVHTYGVSSLLDTPAAVIVRAKSNWDGTPQPLTKLLQLYHRQESTDIRDKVYALHGLASDSDEIAVDYTIEPKDLLVEVIYHACSSSHDSNRNILRFATIMRSALMVHCDDAELLFHISVARGEGIEKDYGLRQKPGSVIQDGTEFMQRYECYNKNCNKFFLSVESRTRHMQIHMDEAKLLIEMGIEGLDWEDEGRDEVMGE